MSSIISVDQIVSESEIEPSPIQPPGQTVDELNFSGVIPADRVVSESHPVLDRTAEELAADKTFDPIGYAAKHSAQIGSGDALQKLARAQRLRESKWRNPVSMPLEVGKASLELAKEIPSMIGSVAKSGARLALTAPPSGAAPATPALESATQSAGEVAAGADTTAAGYTQMVGPIRNALSKIPVGSIFSGISVGDAAKFFAPENTSLLPDDKLSDDQYVGRFAEKVAARQLSEEAAAGEGAIASALGVSSEELKKQGLQPDPKAIQAWSMVLDPLNLVPGAEGFAVASKSGQTLFRATSEKAARAVMENLGRYAEKQGALMAERGATTSRTKLGALGAAATTALGGGPVGGAIAGALVPPAMKLGGWALEKSGASLAKGPGTLTKAGLDVAAGAVSGVGAALNPAKNPVAVVPLAAAAGAGTDEEAATYLSGPLAFGFVGGAAGGSLKAAKRGTQAVTEAALAKLWETRAAEETLASPLGTDSVLDNAHAGADAALRQSNPGAANKINWIRGAMKSRFGTELYLLDNAEFSRRVAEATGSPEGTQFNAAGYFDGANKRVYLNQNATALGHEVGHAIFASMDTESKGKFLEALRAGFKPEQIEEFGRYYNELLGAGKGTESRSLQSPDLVLEEVAAEVLTRVANSESFSADNAPGFLRRAVEVATGFAEQLGLYEAGLGGENATALGLGTPAEATRLGAEAVRTRVDPASPPPVPPVPPSAGPRDPNTPPPTPSGTAAGAGAGNTPPPATPQSPPTPAAPSSSNLRVTPEQQRAADVQRKITNADAAEAAVRANPTVYSPETAKVFSDLNSVMQRAPGDVAPVSLEYNSVKTAGAGNKAKPRGEEQAVAYALEQAGLPADLRAVVEKTTIPYRWTVRDQNVNLNAMSVDKVLANVGTIVDRAESGKAADLVPYDNAGGKLTDAGWRQFVTDMTIYTRNQANGYAGDGSVVTRPAGYRGDLPAVNQTYRPTALPRAQADFINLAMALPPPRTSRAPKGFAGVDPVNFPNVQAATLAEGNQRMVVRPAPTAELGKNVYTQRGANIEIAETNPLRAQFANKGVDFTGRELFQVTEELNLQDIKSVTSKPQSQFRAPNTDLIRGGFMPEPQLRAAEPQKRAARSSFMPDVPSARPSSLPKNVEVRRIADEYAKSAGIPYRPFEDYVPVVEDRAKRLADAYEAAPDEPGRPEVQKAYQTLADETVAQYRALEAAGYKLEPWEGQGEPYKSSAEMAADVRDNKHLWFFLTDNGFGTLNEASANNPLLAKTGIVLNGRELVVNDVFRGVHDFFGHAKEGYQFGPQGEYNAYLAHSRMFSDAALPALASETLAQNSWVNYGKHLRRADGSVPKKGDADYVPITERPFADQKATWLPPELISEATPGRFMPARTEAGKRLEAAGLKVDPIEEMRFGTGQFGVEIRDPQRPLGDQSVARVTASASSPKDATVHMAWTKPERRRQGLMDAAYRELGTQLQDAGIERLAGTVINPRAILPMRENIFGPALVVRPTPGDTRAMRVVSGIDKNAKFMPAPTPEHDTIAKGTFGLAYENLGEGQRRDVERTVARRTKEREDLQKIVDAAPGIDTPAFKEWFGDSAFREADGTPLVLYHGTENSWTKVNVPEGSSVKNALFMTPDFGLATTYSGSRRELPGTRLPTPKELLDPKVADLWDVRIDQDPDSGSYEVYFEGAYQFEVPSREGSRGPEKPESQRQAELLRGLAGLLPYLQDPRGSRGVLPLYASVAPDKVLTIDWQGNHWNDGPEFPGQTTNEAARDAFDMGYEALRIQNVSDPGKHSLGYETGEVVVIKNPEGKVKSVENIGSWDRNNPDIRFMPSLAEYEARRAARKPPEPIRVVPKVAPGQAQYVTKPVLPDSVGDKSLRLVHYSGKAGLTELDPKFMGKGFATPGDTRGKPKTYFFVEGSKTGADKPISAGNPYGARVHGGAIYDLVNGSDPLNWLGNPNREKADQSLIDAGYAGLRVKSQGRDVVAMFKPTAVTALGAPSKAAATAKVPAGAPKFIMPEVPRIDRSIEELDKLGNKDLPQVNAKTIEYPDNPAYPESIALPSRWGLVNDKIVGMPKSPKEVADIVVRQVDRLERAIQDMPEFARESARFYLDMGLSALDLARGARPGVSGKELHNTADLMLRFLALGSPRTGVAANATKSAYSVSAAASDFTPGLKIGFGSQQAGAKAAMESWKQNKPFDLNMPGIDNKVRNFYLNGIAEIIDIAKRDGDIEAYDHLMKNVAGSLGLVEPGAELPKSMYGEVQRLLDGMATVDMWDMAAKGFAWPGYLIDPAKRNKETQPWQWSQDKFAETTTLADPRWDRMLRELSTAEKRPVNGVEDLRYQQARALRVEGNRDWTQKTWQDRVDSGVPFSPDTEITVFTDGSEAGLSPGGAGPLYDAQQSIDGLIADEINSRGLAPLFGKEKLLARNAQEILWALERLDNPVEANNELALFGQTFGAVRQSLEALQLGERQSPDSRGEVVLDAMTRAYEQMATQTIPIEVVSAGTSPEAQRIQRKIAQLREAGDPAPERTLTESVASTLLDDLNTAAEKHDVNVVVDSVQVGLGGYSEGGIANTAPNTVLRLRGSVDGVRKILGVLSRSMDQDGGNIFRRPTIREINDPKTKMNNVLTFDTRDLSPEQQAEFFQDLNSLTDAEGNPFLTGFTHTADGMAIGDQFYSGDMIGALSANKTRVAQIMRQHGVEGFRRERLIVDTFHRGTPAQPGYAKDPFVRDVTKRVQQRIEAAAPPETPFPISLDTKARLERLTKESSFKRFTGKTAASRYFIDLASQVDVAILRNELDEKTGETIKAEINRIAKRKTAQAVKNSAKN